MSISVLGRGRPNPDTHRSGSVAFRVAVPAFTAAVWIGDARTRTDQAMLRNGFVADQVDSSRTLIVVSRRDVLAARGSAVASPQALIAMPQLTGFSQTLPTTVRKAPRSCQGTAWAQRRSNRIQGIAVAVGVLAVLLTLIIGLWAPQRLKSSHFEAVPRRREGRRGIRFGGSPDGENPCPYIRSGAQRPTSARRRR